jgi:hypothetical protein
MRTGTIAAAALLLLISGIGAGCKNQEPDDDEQRFRCLSLEAQYLSEKRNLVASERLIAEATQVGFSSKRGSCVAMFAISDASKHSFEEYEVIKLPSRELFSTSICAAEIGYVCVDPKPLAIANRVYREAMDNRYGPKLSQVYRTPERPDDRSLYAKSKVAP